MATETSTPVRSTRPRVNARFGLVLLEVIRLMDHPGEILEDENVAETMPRRLGLSDVVERQIHFYRGEVRRRGRMTDEQVRDLMRLVVRRPDAEEVFWKAGRRMAGEEDGGTSAIRRIMPRPVQQVLARRQVRRGLRAIFGRRIGGFAPGPFALEGRSLPFIQADPGGCACHFVSGYCQTVVERTLGPDYQVVHSQCEARRDPLCRWTITGDVRSSEKSRVAELAESS